MPSWRIRNPARPAEAHQRGRLAFSSSNMDRQRNHDERPSETIDLWFHGDARALRENDLRGHVPKHENVGGSLSHSPGLTMHADPSWRTGDVAQGTQDLGFRGEAAVLIPVRNRP